MRRWVVALAVALMLTGCGTSDKRFELPVPGPGVSYTATIVIRGAHSLPFHNGEAELRGTVTADGGPANGSQLPKVSIADGAPPP